MLLAARNMLVVVNLEDQSILLNLMRPPSNAEKLLFSINLVGRMLFINFEFCGWHASFSNNANLVGLDVHVAIGEGLFSYCGWELWEVSWCMLERTTRSLMRKSCIFILCVTYFNHSPCEDYFWTCFGNKSPNSVKFAATYPMYKESRECYDYENDLQWATSVW